MATGEPWVVSFRIAEGGCRKRLGGRNPSDCVCLSSISFAFNRHSLCLPVGCPPLVRARAGADSAAPFCCVKLALGPPALTVELPAIAPQTAA